MQDVLNLNESALALYEQNKQDVQQQSQDISSLEERVSEQITQLNDSTDDLQQLLEEDMLSLEQFGENISTRITKDVLQLNSSVGNLQQSLQAQDQLLSQITCANFSQSSLPGFYWVGNYSMRVYCDTAITSCADLSSSHPSGYYWVRTSSNTNIRVYCDMTRSCGGVTGGWTRLAYLDMTVSSHQCPSGFTMRQDSGIRTCVSSDNSAGCTAVTYDMLSVANIHYSKLCGKVIGYQVGASNAFGFNNRDIDTYYVDGVSITHGDPRQHIWTFAAALDKSGSQLQNNNRESYCPCQTATQNNQPTHNAPPFVGNDYFCDAGNEVYTTGEYGFQSEPLWDGSGCACCTNPPWFYKQLPQSTTDNIQVRVCKDKENSNEDIAIQEIEIYVQ